MTRFFLLSALIPLFARLCYTDIRYRELEHLFILLTMTGAFFTEVPFMERLLGLTLPLMLFRLLGSGDVYLLCSLGFVFGAYDLFEIFALASVSSGILCSLALIFGKVKKEDTLPFAPYICVSCLAMIIRDMILP